MLSDTMIPKSIPTEQPLKMFREMLAHGSLFRLWAKMMHRRFSLLVLGETLKNHPVEASHFAGLKAVHIDHIQGTLNKAGEFDAEFNPTQNRSLSRWVGIALEKLRGNDLPPVYLIQVDGIYYVRDGHHRISVSRAMGQAFIDAEVTIMQLQQSLIR